jgi:hypothetical protein
MKGLTVHPVIWEHLYGILKVLKGLPTFPTEFPISPFNEGLSLEIFIQALQVDFIQCEVFSDST